MFALYESALAATIFEPKDGHLLLEIRHLSEKDSESTEVIETPLHAEEIPSALQTNVRPVGLRVL